MMLRTRIKICGITRSSDALTAARLGADAIGLVFYPPSPRSITIEKAHAIASALPPFVTLVALFVDPDHAFVEEVLSTLPIDLLQFHGEETPTDCEQYGCPYIKAARMREGMELSTWMERFRNARALLLDTYHKGARGGTGETFDWRLVPSQRTLPIILAGGLNPNNVREAIRMVKPFAVDVSGGVESGKGIKDEDRMAEFIAAVNSYESEHASPSRQG
uniref:N-(5'-phosphoribosyl)anthranilate isomerase n=1 Tax=Candidatus Kentrum sp. LPFa TaxID=2126335 RepID=A0A450WVV9_9GAMM|nr:MAG: phosphoribosylanthranilate isomerase [Candidatus Kentron sp. LPFa]VFK34397.1 MAG: phosphoribosylanthranilate isomerase [Candidatus Kentron sp. LPFa]